MTRIDEGHQALDPIIKRCEALNLENANEAETRLKVIDEILFKALGWNIEDVSIEERVSEGGTTLFADYIVRTVSSSFLIEAKKVGVTFSLPPNRKSLKLGGVLSQGEIGSAIHQARDYCRKKSIPFAVVTNGSSWIIFPAVRIDGIEFEESEARIFKSLTDIEERFVDFWELLSRQRVLDGNLEHVLLGNPEQFDTPRVLRQILFEPGYRLGRNSLYDHIEPAINKALSDEALLQDDEALSQCYVKTSERLKFDSRLQMQLKDTMPPLGRPTMRIRTRKHAGTFEAKLKEASIHNLPKFITLLGPVGAGKTTFINYVRKISAANSIENKIIWIHIDFKEASPSDKPHQFIYKKVLEFIDSDVEFTLGDWAQSIQPAYKEFIDTLKKGVLFLLFKNNSVEFENTIAQQISKEREEIDPFIVKILSNAVKKFPGFLIIDNVDQIEDPSIQESIFLEAQALARKIGFNVIMSMRESTYLRHRDSPIFDAFQLESLYIDPPNIAPVLALRLGYAKKVLAGKAVTLKTERGISIVIDDMSVFFDVVSKSLLDSEAGLLIECLSGGNIRRGLSLIREFLSSGHTNADRAIAAYLRDGDYKFQKHEIFKGSVLGSFKYFNDELSLLPNLFDSKLKKSGLQLLRLRIVIKALSMSFDQPEEGIHFSELCDVVNRLGVTEVDLWRTVDDLVKRGLLKTADGLTVNNDSIMFPTRLAGYSLKHFCKQFSYTEFCCLDTIIYNHDIWSNLAQITNQIESTQDIIEKILLRCDRLELYFKYLILLEEQWVVECSRRELGNEWQSQIIKNELWPSIKNDAESAVISAYNRYGNHGFGIRKLLNRPGKIGDFQLQHGILAGSEPNRDYAFIRDALGNKYFAHKTKFVTEHEWNNKFNDCECEFLSTIADGKPQAFSISCKR